MLIKSGIELLGEHAGWQSTLGDPIDQFEGSIKVGLGFGGGGGGSSSSETQSDRSGLVRQPGGTFEPRICKQHS